jgi:butyryl-CoA dehydrogenase|uniref:Acyl-CoA dehydrogenase n=1 Tax=candidate division WOR-3 bacterium TaxID=2052148 RepID=A0A7C3YUE9_UNCW3
MSEDLRQEIRRFLEKELIPVESSLEDLKRNLKRLAERGYLGIIYPKEYGGLGGNYALYSLVCEEVSRICPSTGLTLCAHNSLGTYPLFKFGNEEQKRKYLPFLCRGEKIGAFGLTEPNAGSDAGAIETKAEKRADGYLLQGTKRFITSGGIAEIFLIAATLDKRLGTKGISIFIVEKGMKGFSIGKEEDKLGVRGSNTVELIFEDCFVPKENLLGKEGEGYRYFMETLDGGRISIASFALGIAQASFERIVQWEKERNTRSQLVYKILSDLSTQITAARLLTNYACELKDRGERADLEACQAKLFASEVAWKAASDALRIFGYEGLITSSLERFYRDCKIAEIGEGTSEIMRLIIAREVLKMGK